MQGLKVELLLNSQGQGRSPLGSRMKGKAAKIQTRAELATKGRGSRGDFGLQPIKLTPADWSKS